MPAWASLHSCPLLFLIPSECMEATLSTMPKAGLYPALREVIQEVISIYGPNSRQASHSPALRELNDKVKEGVRRQALRKGE